MQFQTPEVQKLSFTYTVISTILIIIIVGIASFAVVKVIKRFQDILDPIFGSKIGNKQRHRTLLGREPAESLVIDSQSLCYNCTRSGLLKSLESYLTTKQPQAEMCNVAARELLR